MTFTLGPWTLTLGPAVPAPAPASPPAIPSSDATLLTDEQFIRIWRHIDGDSEPLRAIKQLLARELVAAIQDASTPTLADRPGALAQAQGAMIALLNFSATLETARREPERWTSQPHPKIRSRGGEA